MVSSPVTPAADALARLYDLDMVDDPGDLDLWLALAGRTGGPILELAAGSGRIAVPLAVAGYEVTAVDIDPAMLARARTAAQQTGPDGAARLSAVQGDLLGLRLEDAGRYRLAFIALNSLFLLPTRDAQRDAIRTLAVHLAPGGLAVVDVWLPDADDLRRFDGRLVLEYERRDPETGRRVTKAASARHDAASATVELTSIYEEGDDGTPSVRWVRRDVLRLVGADELAAMAEDAGLGVEVIAGDYDLGTLGTGSERAILVAVRP